MRIRILFINRKDGFLAVHAFGGWKAAVPGLSRGRTTRVSRRLPECLGCARTGSPPLEP